MLCYSERWSYFVFRNEIFNYIRDDEEAVLEPFNRLIEEGRLMAYKYDGFSARWLPSKTGKCQRKWWNADTLPGASFNTPLRQS